MQPWALAKPDSKLVQRNHINETNYVLAFRNFHQHQINNQPPDSFHIKMFFSCPPLQRGIVLCIILESGSWVFSVENKPPPPTHSPVYARKREITRHALRVSYALQEFDRCGAGIPRLQQGKLSKDTPSPTTTMATRILETSIKCKQNWGFPGIFLHSQGQAEGRKMLDSLLFWNELLMLFL